MNDIFGSCLNTSRISVPDMNNYQIEVDHSSGTRDFVFTWIPRQERQMSAAQEFQDRHMNQNHKPKGNKE